MSVMARCAATPSTCDSAKDVMAWTTVAAPAASASGSSISARRFPITSSMRNFEVAGSTSPDSRLTSISARPSVSRPRRAQMSALASFHAADVSAFFFFFFSGVSATVPLACRWLRVFLRISGAEDLPSPVPCL